MTVAIASWMTTLMRAVRATRLYPAGSPARTHTVAEAHAELEAIFHLQSSVTIVLRESTVFVDGEPVYVAQGRDPFVYILYSNGIFELSFDAGITSAELARFLDALAVDDRAAGENLATALWKLGLTRVRYRHYDILRVARSRDEAAFFEDVLSDEEARRLRERVDLIALRLGDDISGADAPTLAGPDAPQPHNHLRAAREKLSRSLSPGALTRFRHDLQKNDTDDAVAHRLAVLLIRALSVDPSCSTASPLVLSLLRLLEDMVAGARFDHAARVLAHLRTSPSKRVALVARAIHKRLARPASIDAAFASLADMDHFERRTALLELCTYLRTLGSPALEAVITLARGVVDPAELQQLAEVIAELAEDDPSLLAAFFPELGLELASELLALSRAWSLDRAELLLLQGLAHSNAKVRSRALRILVAMSHPATAQSIARALHDGDATVRTTALRLAAARKIAPAVHEIRETLRSKDLVQRDAHELRLLFETLAILEGSRAIETLERFVFTHALSLSASEMQLSAALALARIDDDAARDHLERGAESIKPSVRAACRRALKTPRAEPIEEPSVTPPPQLEQTGVVRSIRGGRVQLLEPRKASNGGRR